MSSFCTVEGCQKDAQVRGLCRAHYLSLRKRGELRMNTETLNERGRKQDHPLYVRWNKMKSQGNLADEWQDFWRFVDDVGPDASTAKMLRLDQSKPMGPGNWRWAKKLEGDERRSYYRDWYRKSERGRGIKLERQYGITFEQYQAMHDEQDGLCAICGEPEMTPVKSGHDERRFLSVDHDHSTGAVRALLCRPCNQTLGLMDDDMTRLEAAIAYLRKWRAT